MWLMQSASASVDGFTPSAIILALAAVVSTLAAVLMRGWQERLKTAEAEERERTKQLLDSALARAEKAEARATYLEDQRGHLAAKLLEARLQVQQQRSQSPPPTNYSMQTPTKTRPSRG